MSDVTTAGAWKKMAVHPVTCPSGAEISIKIPDLARMIECGEIPQHLLDAAIGVAADSAERPTVELIKQQREFTDLVVLASVAIPKITEADVKDLPYEDKEFIVSVATRQRDLDAVGEHIGGLTKSDKFRKFRGLDGFDADVANL